MHGQNAGLFVEHLSSQVTGAAIAAAAVIELAGVGLGIGQQVGQAADLQTLRCLGIHDQHIGYPQHLRDGRKVTARVVGHGFVQPGVDGVRGSGCDANGQAVGRGLGHQIGTDVSPSAGAVFYDDRAQAVFDPLGQRSGSHINRAARGVGHDQSDRLGLRQGAR